MWVKEDKKDWISMLSTLDNSFAKKRFRPPRERERERRRRQRRRPTTKNALLRGAIALCAWERWSRRNDDDGTTGPPPPPEEDDDVHNNESSRDDATG